MTSFNATITRICLQISFPREDKPHSSSCSGIGGRIRSNNGALSCILVGNMGVVIQGSIRIECQAVGQIGIADEGRDRVDTGSVVGVGYSLQRGHCDACEDNEEGVDKRERGEGHPIILRMYRMRDMKLKATCSLTRGLNFIALNTFLLN